MVKRKKKFNSKKYSLLTRDPVVACGNPSLKLHKKIDQLFYRAFNQFGLDSYLTSLFESCYSTLPALTKGNGLPNLGNSAKNSGYKISVNLDLLRTTHQLTP